MTCKEQQRKVKQHIVMNCHILIVAHNATITGPKCRVCVAFPIEMSQSVGIEILIMSFPQGLRPALLLEKRETSASSLLSKDRDK